MFLSEAAHFVVCVNYEEWVVSSGSFSTPALTINTISEMWFCFAGVYGDAAV